MTMTTWKEHKLAATGGKVWSRGSRVAICWTDGSEHNYVGTIAAPDHDPTRCVCADCRTASGDSPKEVAKKLGLPTAGLDF
jgi:hypothetical protein